jgi:hypothetical protein
MMLCGQHTVPLAPAAIRTRLPRLAILYHGISRKTTNMSKATEIIESELAPLIDIHKEGVPQALKKLVAEVRKEAIDQALKEASTVASKCYYQDEGGFSPMDPVRIAKTIREDAPIVFGFRLAEDGGLEDIPEPTAEEKKQSLSEVDEILGSILD